MWASFRLFALLQTCQYVVLTKAAPVLPCFKQVLRAAALDLHQMPGMVQQDLSQTNFRRSRSGSSRYCFQLELRVATAAPSKTR